MVKFVQNVIHQVQQKVLSIADDFVRWLCTVFPSLEMRKYQRNILLLAVIVTLGCVKCQSKLYCTRVRKKIIKFIDIKMSGPGIVV